MKGKGTIVATGSIAYPVGLGNIGDMIGAEKVMTMTSTYDHRVIQGAESGRFLQVVEAYLQGENGFYDGVFASLGAQLGPAPDAARARRRRGRRARVPRRRPPRAGHRRGAAAGRPGRDVAAQGAPHARPPRRASSTRWAPSPRAIRRSTRTPSA